MVAQGIKLGLGSAPELLDMTPAQIHALTDELTGNTARQRARRQGQALVTLLGIPLDALRPGFGKLELER